MVVRVLTDIHAHVLPGLDDGPLDLPETERLLDAFLDAHIDRVFCTSHYRSPHFDVTLPAMYDAFEQTTELNRSRSYRVGLSLGAEIRLSTKLTKDIQAEQIPTLGNTRYVLVEFNTVDITQEALNLIYELQIRDLIPIVAHPERYVAIQRDPKIVDTLREQGLLMQATAQCFSAKESASQKSFKLAWQLLEQGKIDVIATDAHNTTSRPPRLVEAYDAIAERLGERVTETLIDNANAIWDGVPCRPIEVPVRQRSGLWSFFRKW